MALAALFFSLMSLGVKVAGQTLPTGEIVFARVLVTLMVSIAVLRFTRTPMWGVNRRLLVLRGTFGFLALNAFFYSVVHLPLAEATVLHFMSPVFTAVVATRWLGEKLGIREVVGGAISFAGVLVFASPGREGFTGGLGSTFAVAVGLSGALVSAFAYSSVRELRRTDDPNVVVFYFPLVALPLSIPMLLVDCRWPVGHEWLLLLGVGLATQIAQMCLTRAIHLEPAGRVAGVSYLQIAFSTGWNVLVFGQWPTLQGLVGIALIVVGTTVVIRARPAS